MREECILTNWQRPGLPPTARPTEIGAWINVARKGRVKANAATYEQRWWSWWTRINPEWRKDDNGELTRGDGDWSPFFKSGINAFLSLLASLLGLKDVTKLEAWERALEDVHYVLGEVLRAKEEAGYGFFADLHGFRTKFYIYYRPTGETDANEDADAENEMPPRKKRRKTRR